MVRFLHSADWQLGMRRHYLDEDAIPRFVQARISAIRTMGDIVREKMCAFMVVSGDVFDANHLDRRTVGRALDALGTVPCPVFLLPGNHDPLDAGSIYRSREFSGRRPANVHVLDSEPVMVGRGVQLVGAPWLSKRPRLDLVAQACAELEPAGDMLRICVAHGVVDELYPESARPELISLAEMDALLQQEVVHYFALGDRHSVTEVGPRIWYAGTPEPSDYAEVDPGKCLMVDLSRDACNVTPLQVGHWRFLHEAFDLTSVDDVEHLASYLDKLPDKEVTIHKLALRGTLNLRARARLDEILEEARPLFAALDDQDRNNDLVVVPDKPDLEMLDLAGFARATVEELRDLSEGEGEDAVTARDAMALLYRIVLGARS